MGASPLNVLFRLVFIDSSLVTLLAILLTWEMLGTMGCLEEDVGLESSQT